MAKAQILKPFILFWEGGYVNDPNDSGGATNKGITLTTFRNTFGKAKTVKDLRKMTDAQWQTIFEKYYWNLWHANEIVDKSLANILVDWVWLSGSYGIKLPQEMLGVTADGIVGEKTLKALNAKDARTFFDELKARREKYIDDIIKKSPKNEKYRKGWLNRLAGIAYGSLTYGKTKNIF